MHLNSCDLHLAALRQRPPETRSRMHNLILRLQRAKLHSNDTASPRGIMETTRSTSCIVAQPESSLTGPQSVVFIATLLTIKAHQFAKWPPKWTVEA